MALAAVDRETEVTYIHRERDWLQRAADEGRFVDRGKLLPVLPASIASGAGGNGGGSMALATTGAEAGAGGSHMHAE
jgi:hypothetical protein